MARWVIAAAALGCLMLGWTLGAPAARADGTVAVRGIYYKERATRVEQPMVDAHLDAGEDGHVDAHVLVDAITSASVSSGAAGSSFTEKRYETGIDYTHDFRRGRLGVATRFSREPDYTSLFGGVAGELDLADKDTVLGGGLGLGFDHVTNAGNQNPMAAPIEGDLTSLTLSASIRQIVDRRTVVSLSWDAARLDGFQQNPYRQAITDEGFAPERHPDLRWRNAVALTVRRFLDRTDTAVVASYRFYHDTWGIDAHTPELRLIQEVGETVDATLGYRLYIQSKADFYQDRYTTANPDVNRFLSDDTKLSAFTSHTFEGKLGLLGETFGLEDSWADARFEAIMSYVVQGNRFGNAIIGELAFTVPLNY